MKRRAAIYRLRQMLATETHFLEHCKEEKAKADIIKYQRDGVEALKKAIACLEER